MKSALKCLMGLFCLLTGCYKSQVPEDAKYSVYLSTLFQYETNLCFMATNGQKYWTDIFKDIRIPLARKLDLVGEINAVASSPNKPMDEKVKRLVKETVSRPRDKKILDEFLAEMGDMKKVTEYLDKCDLLGLLGEMRDKHSFHEAFLSYNYIDETFLYSLPEGIGGREISVLSELTALHGEHEWNTILTDKGVDLGLKHGLVIDIHDMARYGEYPHPVFCTKSDYVSILFQYETNLCFMAANGQKHWTDIFKDTRIPIARQLDLLIKIDDISQPNEAMDQKVRKIIKQNVPKNVAENEDPDKDKRELLGVLENMRDKYSFHIAFLIYNYIGNTFLCSLPEGVGDREIAVLSELTALHGEREWNAILTDKNVDIGLKRRLVIDIHDRVRYAR